MALHKLSGSYLAWEGFHLKVHESDACDANTMREAFALEAKGLQADGIRGQAEWARLIAAEIRKQGMAKSKEVIQANGEAVPSRTEGFPYDTLTVPDLAAVEASFDRTPSDARHDCRPVSAAVKSNSA